MTDRMTIKFWGVRGSYPVPGPATLRYGGNTPCVEVRANGQLLILDAGTGIIGLGNDLMRRSRESGGPIVATLLLTHMHHDHTQGFPFFLPAYIGSSILHIFGPGIFEHDLQEGLGRAMLPPAFPVPLTEMSSRKYVRNISETDIMLLGDAVGGVALRNLYHEQVEDDPGVLRVRVLRSYAHPDGVFNYRIEYGGRALVYATDTEGYVGGDQRLVAFARGADILIHDAQYTEEHYLGRRPGAPATQGWGHSTATMATDVARAAGVKQLVLFHHEPQYDDETIARIEGQSKKRFTNTIAAYEGLELTL